MQYDEGNTLKSQDNRASLKALPLEPMEWGMLTCEGDIILRPFLDDDRYNGTGEEEP